MEQEIHSRLPAPSYRYFESLPSTNDSALQWAQEGAPDGALVIANEQTAGRGRMDRRWLTPPGSALAFSLVLRPSPAELQKPALFSPLGGLALSAALENHYGLQPQIKWPNDVLLGGKKTAGILAETIWTGEVLTAVILGIGVNIAPASVPPAGQIQFPATCIEYAAGQPVDRWELLAALLRALQEWRPKLTSAAFLQAWTQRLAFIGESVQVLQPNKKTVHGIMTGITADGDVRLELPDGQEKLFAAGDVHLRQLDENPVQ